MVTASDFYGRGGGGGGAGKYFWGWNFVFTSNAILSFYLYIKQYLQ